MSTATADEPKTEETPKKAKHPHKKESFDETVDVRFWNGTAFINPVKGVPAYRGTDGDGAACIWTRHSPATAGNPKKGSELIDTDGVTWVVDKTAGDLHYTLCYVTRKP